VIWVRRGTPVLSSWSLLSRIREAKEDPDTPRSRDPQMVPGPASFFSAAIWAARLRLFRRRAFVVPSIKEWKKVTFPPELSRTHLFLLPPVITSTPRRTGISDGAHSDFFFCRRFLFLGRCPLFLFLSLGIEPPNDA